jgi:hypothetical protein
MLSDYRTESFQYLITRLSTNKYTSGPTTSPAKDSIIPSLVGKLVGTRVK